MIKWVEAYRVVDEYTVSLAALNVTNEVDGGDSVLSELKTIYGDTATYQYHTCYHDEGRSCKITPA